MVNLKCDETCKGGDNCTNSRIYISGLPKGCTADDITDMFGGLGTIARERPQGRGVFPDMMPYRVKFYGNDDCLLHYEDPHAAHAAPSFFDGQELKGSKLHVEMAEKKPNQGLPAGYYIPPEAKGQSYGSGGAGRGGGPPRGNYGPPGATTAAAAAAMAVRGATTAGATTAAATTGATTTAATGATTTAATGRAGRAAATATATATAGATAATAAATAGPARARAAGAAAATAFCSLARRRPN